MRLQRVSLAPPHKRQVSTLIAGTSRTSWQTHRAPFAKRTGPGVGPKPHSLVEARTPCPFWPTSLLLFVPNNTKLCASRVSRPHPSTAFFL